METLFTPDIQRELASPFEDSQVGWKPQITTKGRDKAPIMRGDTQVAGCTAHIDARAVMNRLDEVVGVGNWSDSYTVLPNGKNVECTLTVFGVSKSDVGEPNDGGFADQMKAAYSDALKRAAVKFGIGRYLYDMEMEWLPFDGYKVVESPKPRPAVKQSPPEPQGKPTTPRQPQQAVQAPVKQQGATEADFEGLPVVFMKGDTVASKRNGAKWVVSDVLRDGDIQVVNDSGELHTISSDKVRLIERKPDQPALIPAPNGYEA